MPERVDFLSFDPGGSLYLGVSERDRVLRIDVNRPGAPGGVVPAMEVGSVVDSQFAGHQ